VLGRFCAHDRVVRDPRNQPSSAAHNRLRRRRGRFALRGEWSSHRATNTCVKPDAGTASEADRSPQADESGDASGDEARRAEAEKRILTCDPGCPWTRTPSLTRLQRCPQQEAVSSVWLPRERAAADLTSSTQHRWRSEGLAPRPGCIEAGRSLQI